MYLFNISFGDFDEAPRKRKADEKEVKNKSSERLEVTTELLIL
jgi:hypothetical protein